MKLNSSSYARPGSSAKASEDRVAILPLEGEGLLCVLSDGVGTARDPGRCAERVVRLVLDNFAARPKQWPIRKSFQFLVAQANESLQREGFYRDGTVSMQATLAVACLAENRIFGLNVGDSPILLRRGDRVERLSRDHVQVAPEGMERVTQTVGMGPQLSPYFFERELAEEDSVILTSDGLTRLMKDEALGRLIKKTSTARQVVQEAACSFQEQDFDDLSLIVVHVEELKKSAPVERAEAGHEFPRPARGREFAGYELQTRVAGNSRVWLAKKDGRRHVLKFIPQEAETDESGTLLARFSREAWNASRLHAEFFVPARPAPDGNPNFYVMDYVEWPSLKRLLKSRLLSAEETVELGRFLCRAGQFLMGHELVHGDIKPDNLLVGREQGEMVFKLLDLGLAGPVFTDATGSGTPSYLAPERFAGALLGEGSEIFSIGATLYEALSGRPPFGELERFQKPKWGVIPRLSRINPNVPLWLECVIFKCLSLSREGRYECYSELLFALEHPATAPWEAVRGSLLERDPLRFYQAGFWLFFICTLVLLLLLLWGAP